MEHLSRQGIKLLSYYGLIPPTGWANYQYHTTINIVSTSAIIISEGDKCYREAGLILHFPSFLYASAHITNVMRMQPQCKPILISCRPHNAGFSSRY